MWGDWDDRHTPRPGRGELLSCLISGNHDGQIFHEVWCHPSDTDALLDGGISTVNGLPVAVQVVDRLPHADQLRITVRKGST